MKTKLINSIINDHQGYSAGSGDTERYEYECPCGNGKIIEEHDNIPGCRDRTVYFNCNECRNKFNIDTSKGVHNWEITEKIS